LPIAADGENGWASRASFPAGSTGGRTKSLKPYLGRDLVVLEIRVWAEGRPRKVSEPGGLLLQEQADTRHRSGRKEWSQDLPTYFPFTSQNRSTHTYFTFSGFLGGAAHRYTSPCSFVLPSL
jgi:hypothetical protein